MTVGTESQTYSLGRRRTHRLLFLKFATVAEMKIVVGGVALFAAAMLASFWLPHSIAMVPAGVIAVLVLIVGGLTQVSSASGRLSLAGAWFAAFVARTKRLSGLDVYRSGALEAGVMIGGEPVPVPPPPYVGDVDFKEADDGTGVIFVRQESAMCVVLEVYGRGTDAKGMAERVGDTNMFGWVLSQLGSAGSYVDRLTVLDRRFPENLKAHADFVAENTPATLPPVVNESYEEVEDFMESVGEDTRYFVVVRVRNTRSVSRAVTRMAPRGARDAERYYVEFMAMQAARVASVFVNHGFTLAPSRQRVKAGVLRRGEILALNRHTFDPDRPIDAVHGASPNWVWPLKSVSRTHELVTTGRSGDWVHRGYVVGEYPVGDVSAGYFDGLWRLVDRMDDPLDQFAIIRTNVTIYDLVPPHIARKTARPEAAQDVGKQISDEKQGKVDPETGPAEQAQRVLGELKSGGCGVRMNCFVVLSARAGDLSDDSYESDPLGNADESLVSEALGRGVFLELCTNEHDGALAAALTYCYGVQNTRKGRR